MPRPDSRVLALALLFCSVLAAADPHSRSWSHWTLEDHAATASFSLAARDAARLPPLPRGDGLHARLSAHLAEHIAVIDREHRPCPLGQVTAISAEPGTLVQELVFDCGESSPAAIAITALFDVTGGHVHFARLVTGDRAPLERLLTRNHMTIDLPGAEANAEAAAGSIWTTYFPVGMDHILEGADHLAFLLALLLLSPGLSGIVKVVTGFTLGHCLTLSLATLAWIEPAPALVDATIGATIALVAAEITARRQDWRPLALACTALVLIPVALGSGAAPALWVTGILLLCLSYLGLARNPAALGEWPRAAMATGFGMIHGLGFAGALMDIGLPREQLVGALLAFNLGVEAGQLLVVVALAVAGRALVATYPASARAWGTDAALGGLAALGVYWYVSRTLGL